MTIAMAITEAVEVAAAEVTGATTSLAIKMIAKNLGRRIAKSRKSNNQKL